MAEAAIRVERRGGVVRCTLDRPPLNLFEPGLIASLRATFDTLEVGRPINIEIDVLARYLHRMQALKAV